VQEALGPYGALFSHWQGPTETALYLYGPSAEQIRELVAPAIAPLPLAQLSRIEIIPA
jgi:hypothetical protein